MNNKGIYYLTSESVTEGHPDKVCDQISDAILDAALSVDRYAKVAIECLTKTGFVLVAGELTTKGYIDMQQVVRETLKDIGYDNPDYGLDYKTCGVLTSISEQSPDIAQGVETQDKKEIGAGDQGMMFGFATNETEELMPLPIVLAHKLTKKISLARRNQEIPYLRPDGKSQVTVEYHDGKIKRIDAIVVSVHHDPDVTQEQIHTDIIKHIITPVCGHLMDQHTKIWVNPTGKFVIGGPVADAGVTGRKIIVDTYGGIGRHGGGAFSGKDPTKVDRSGAYAARYIAKNIVAAGIAQKCEIQLSYAIGRPEPVSIYVDTFGTGKISEAAIVALIRKHFPLTPSRIIEELNLRRPIYKETARFGHFGRAEPEFSWEQVDKAKFLKKEAGI
ncbi:MAG: methionine adenosyltransferase [Candidatus Woesearchaeota archaeon]